MNQRLENAASRKRVEELSTVIVSMIEIRDLGAGGGSRAMLLYDK